MTVRDAFDGMRRIYLDTAPAIYFMQRGGQFSSITQAALFHCFDQDIEVVTGPVTLAECLGRPADSDELNGLADLLLRTTEIHFKLLSDPAAIVAGNLRRVTALSLIDALQVGHAMAEDCDAILTNDFGLVAASLTLPVILVGQLEIEA